MTCETKEWRGSTPHYIGPELLKGGRDMIGSHSNIWALGVTGFYIHRLCRLPEAGESGK